MIDPDLKAMNAKSRDFRSLQAVKEMDAARTGPKSATQKRKANKEAHMAGTKGLRR